MSANRHNSLSLSARLARLGLEAASADYRATARQLRHQYRSNPSMLQQSLLQLRDRVNARQKAITMVAPRHLEDPSVEYISAKAKGSYADSFTGKPSPGAASRFAAQVEKALDGPVLRYSARMWLLSQAEKAGLGRFEANLVIASVQHNRRLAGAASAADASASTTPNSRRPHGSLLKGVAFALGLEAATVVAVWMAFRFF